MISSIIPLTNYSIKLGISEFFSVHSQSHSRIGSQAISKHETYQISPGVKTCLMFCCQCSAESEIDDILLSPSALSAAG